MVNIFIDANIWLDLYHFSSNDLDEFSKLKDAIGVDYRLYITDQVVNEVLRNRDSKVSDAYRQFKEIKIKVPNLSKGYDEFKTLERLLKDVYRVHRDLCRKIDDDIMNDNLHADKIINDLLAKSTRISYSSELIEAAKTRYSLGNPPGKNNSYGDAINWESLLSAVSNGEDLFFISEDRDFASALDGQSISSFLRKEWENRKKSKIFFYTSLPTFFNEHLTAIRLKTEEEKNRQIALLYSSGNFRSAHMNIGRLAKYSSFSKDQVRALCQAAQNNDQIGGIIMDDDIRTFYETLLLGNDDIVNEDIAVKWVHDRLTQEESEEE